MKVPGVHVQYEEMLVRLSAELLMFIGSFLSQLKQESAEYPKWPSMLLGLTGQRKLHPFGLLAAELNPPL